MADALAKELDGIDRTRKAFAARIKELNNKRCKDVDDFQRTLNELVRLKIQGEALGAVKEIVVAAYENIVERTPVKTGRAKASWQFSTSAPSDYVPPPGNYKGEINAIVQKTVAEIFRANPDMWYISSNLEYIEALEAGWSDLAPQGMVALALQEMTHQMNSALGKI